MRFSEMFHIPARWSTGLSPTALSASTLLPNTPDPWAVTWDLGDEHPCSRRSVPGRCTTPPACLSLRTHTWASPRTWRTAPGRAFHQGMVSGSGGGELCAPRCLRTETSFGQSRGFSPSLDSILLAAAGCQPPADWFESIACVAVL